MIERMKSKKHSGNIKYKGRIGRQCKIKKRYRNEHEVRQKIKQCLKYRNTELDFYFCECCKGYHITSRMEFRVEGERL